MQGGKRNQDNYDDKDDQTLNIYKKREGYRWSNGGGERETREVLWVGLRRI